MRGSRFFFLGTATREKGGGGSEGYLDLQGVGWWWCWGRGGGGGHVFGNFTMQI